MKNFITAALFVAFSSLVAGVPTWGDWKKKPEGHWNGKHDSPFDFTSVIKVVATPDQVINGTTPTPGQPGAIGYYNFGLKSDENVICYDITLYGVTGAYQSAALTATHIHEAVKGASGPPRIALANPVGDDKKRRSVGCVAGPFKTGIVANGVDSGDGFSVKQIEDNPAGFFCDAHTVLYVPGVVRGQLA